MKTMLVLGLLACGGLAFGQSKGKDDPRPPRPKAHAKAPVDPEVEAKQIAEKVAKAMIERDDLDDDGKIEVGEFKGTKALFGTLDLNADGKLTFAELVKARGKLDARRDDAMMGRVVPLPQRWLEIPISDFDADRNDKISDKELREYLFFLCDQDASGGIDAAEADYVIQWDRMSEDFEGRVEQFFQRLDKDRSSAVEKSEFKLGDRLMQKHDLDRDGMLAPNEIDPPIGAGFEAFANQNPDTLLERYDGNKDGKLSSGELPGGAKSVFARADQDKDGAVSREELSKALANARDYQFQRLPQGFLERYDLNEDKKVSRTEYPGDDATFARLDANGDGAISKSDD